MVYRLNKNAVLSARSHLAYSLADRLKVISVEVEAVNNTVLTVLLGAVHMAPTPTLLSAAFDPRFL